MSRAIADQGRTIRLPLHVLDQVRKLYRANRKLTQQSGALIRCPANWRPNFSCRSSV